jgi:hypothetical protein
MSSNLWQYDTALMKIIGWCWEKLSPTAKIWLAAESQRRKESGDRAAS